MTRRERVMSLIRRLNVAEAVVFENDGGTRVLELFRIWRLEHRTDGSFHAFARNPATFAWTEFPVPAGETCQLSLLADYENLFSVRGWGVPPYPDIAIPIWKGIAPGRFFAMVRQVAGWLCSATGEHDDSNAVANLCRAAFTACHSRDKDASGSPAAFCVRAVLDGMPVEDGCRKAFRRFREPKVFAVAVAAFTAPFLSSVSLPSLKSYMLAAWHRNGVAAVMREHPNLLPLMKNIPCSEWDANPFDDGRHLGSAARHRKWLLRAPYGVVRALCNMVPPASFEDATRFLKESGVRAGKRAELFMTYFHGLDHVGHERMRVLFRAFCGIPKGVMTDSQMGTQALLVRDALRDDPGVLDRPHIGWAGLVRFAEAWHRGRRNVAIDNARPHWRIPIDAVGAWWNPIGEKRTAFEGVEFEELVTADELLSESYVQDHCVVTYVKECRDRGYHVFTFTAEERRWTLGFGTLGDMQLFGCRNSKPPKSVSELAERFMKNAWRS